MCKAALLWPAIAAAALYNWLGRRANIRPYYELPTKLRRSSSNKGSGLLDCWEYTRRDVGVSRILTAIGK